MAPGDEGRNADDLMTWNWRARASDPRAWAMVSVSTFTAIGYCLLAKAPPITTVMLSLGITILVFGIVLMRLPRWRDPAHSVRFGALVMAPLGPLVLLVAVVARFKYDVSI